MTMPPARERRTPGRCRVCGCTDEDACQVGLREAGVEEFGEETSGGKYPVTLVPITCTWVEADLCSRCHGPHRPTRRQACELRRIAAYKGRIRVHRGPLDGTLGVMLLAQGMEGEASHGGMYRPTAPPTIILDRSGHVLR